MNLWAKRAGLLFSAAVLIFLISCEDDSYLLGFKGKTKFKGRYQELVFDGTKSSVVLLDSVFTDQNEGSITIDPVSYRFLVGNYNDPDFGMISAHFYAQFLPGYPTYFNSDKEDPNSIVLDSATIQLMLDFYAYGPEVTIDDVIEVFSLIPFNRDSLNFYDRYITSTTLAYDPTLLAKLSIKKFSKSYSGSSKIRPFFLTPIQFESQTDRNPSNRDSIMFQGKLDETFSLNIFNWIKSKGDTALVSENYLREFGNLFPGLAFFSTKYRRIVGINPLNGLSRLTLHYHTPKNDSVTTPFYFTRYVGANGFTNITNQRSGGLGDLSTPNERYFTDGMYSDERYIQDGPAVITELDLSDFYSFVDTLEDIVINSAELSMEIKDYPSGMNPVPSLYALMMKEVDSKLIPLEMAVEEDSLKMMQFAGNVYTDLINFGIGTELSSANPVKLVYDYHRRQYRGFATLFFQRLFDNKHKIEYKIEHLGFYPAVSPIVRKFTNLDPGHEMLGSATGNTVNRSVLKASGIKLKLYYTVPNKPNLE